MSVIQEMQMETTTRCHLTPIRADGQKQKQKFFRKLQMLERK